jgi:DNA-binding HxlR family transcriptional regulator
MYGALSEGRRRVGLTLTAPETGSSFDPRGKEESMSVATDAVTSVVGQSTTSEASGTRRLDMDLIAAVDSALEVLHGKWKVHLVFAMARGIHRHSRLLECLPGVSKKVMTESLRALERDGLVARKIFAEVPVRVEYSLTPLGWSITEPLIALSEWGAAYADEVQSARSRYEFDGPGNGLPSNDSNPLAAA